MTMLDEAPGAVQETAPSSSSDDLAGLIAQAVAGAISPLQSQLQELESKVNAQSARMPSFKPMETPEDSRAMLGRLQKGEQRSGDRTRIPQGSDSHPLPDHILYGNPSPFEQGQMVRINPDATREGSERTWGEVLADPKNRRIQAENPDAIGTVLRVERYSKYTHLWKYKVRIDGMTRPNGDGFTQDELLPA